MSERAELRSRWGADDQQGAANLVTPEIVLGALKNIKEGRIVDLSHEIRMGVPRIDPVLPPYLFSMWTDPDTTRRIAREQFGATNDPGVFTEHISMSMHTGTHIDALGHFTIGERMFNGCTYQGSSSSWGLERHGMEQMPPLITRGVCIDVSGLDGGDYLEGGRVIGKRDLQRTLQKMSTELQSGDVVMFRTGWERFFMSDGDRYTASEPGIDVETAEWLIEQNVCAIGADNMSVEVLPYPDPKLAWPVHQRTLVEAGVYLIENLALEEARRQNLTTFCFVLLPVKFAGATGCPVRPVAVI